MLLYILISLSVAVMLAVVAFVKIVEARQQRRINRALSEYLVLQEDVSEDQALHYFEDVVMPLIEDTRWPLRKRL